GSIPPSPVFPSSWKAPPLPRRNPGKTFFQTRRPAASCAPSHLPSSLPLLPPPPLALPADSALAPTLPLFRRGTPPAPPAAPWRHAPALARSTPLPQSSRPSRTPDPHSRFPAPLCMAFAPRLPALSGTRRSSTRCARSCPTQSLIASCLGTPPRCCLQSPPRRPAPAWSPVP